ncbi:MAG: hypothetical protein ACRBC3_08770 [Burkholderiaceae bacterium]
MSATLSFLPSNSQPSLSRGTLSICVIGLCLLVLAGVGFSIALHVLAPVVRQLGGLLCCVL